MPPLENNTTFQNPCSWLLPRDRDLLNGTAAPSCDIFGQNISHWSSEVSFRKGRRKKSKHTVKRSCCCRPLWWQVDSVEAVLELCGFVDALLQGLVAASEEHWRTERVRLLLQLLCACQLCLKLNGDCRPLLNSLQRLLPACQQVTQRRLWSNNNLDYLSGQVHSCHNQY